MNGKCDAMFLTPLRNPQLPQRFVDSPIGKNTLANTVKDLMKEAGFEGTYSNHSCRRTAVTRIITATKDTSLAKVATDHKSTVVSEYDESASNSSRLISKILQNKNVSLDANTVQRPNKNLRSRVMMKSMEMKKK